MNQIPYLHLCSPTKLLNPLSNPKQLIFFHLCCWWDQYHLCPAQLIMNPLKFLQHLFHNSNLVFLNQHLYQAHQMPIESPLLDHFSNNLSLILLTHKLVIQECLNLLISENLQEPLDVFSKCVKGIVALSYVYQCGSITTGCFSVKGWRIWSKRWGLRVGEEWGSEGLVGERYGFVGCFGGRGKVGLWGKVGILGCLRSWLEET